MHQFQSFLINEKRPIRQKKLGKRHFKNIGVIFCVFSVLKYKKTLKPTISFFLTVELQKHAHQVVRQCPNPAYPSSKVCFFVFFPFSVLQTGYMYMIMKQNGSKHWALHLYTSICGVPIINLLIFDNIPLKVVLHFYIPRCALRACF